MRMYYLQLPHLRHTRWASATGYKYPQLLPHENLIPRSLYCEYRSSVTRPRQCTSIMFPCIVLFNYQRTRVPHRKRIVILHRLFSSHTAHGQKTLFQVKSQHSAVAICNFQRTPPTVALAGCPLGHSYYIPTLFKSQTNPYLSDYQENIQYIVWGYLKLYNILCFIKLHKGGSFTH